MGTWKIEQKKDFSNKIEEEQKWRRGKVKKWGKKSAKKKRKVFFYKLYGLRIFLWLIGLVNYVGHPQPPQSNWARVYCGCKPGPTRVALHPGRMMEKPERQPYIHWTTCYDFEEMRNIELCSYTSTYKKGEKRKGRGKKGEPKEKKQGGEVEKKEKRKETKTKKKTDKT